MHEQLQSEHTHPTDRALFAYVITAVFFGRCRHSDLVNVVKVLEDWDEQGGSLEVIQGPTKRRRRQPTRHCCYPLWLQSVGWMARTGLFLQRKLFVRWGFAFLAISMALSTDRTQMKTRDQTAGGELLLQRLHGS